MALERPKPVTLRERLSDVELLREGAYIDGAWSQALSGTRTEVINPATEAAIPAPRREARVRGRSPTPVAAQLSAQA
jgi:hypothetical protein